MRLDRHLQDAGRSLDVFVQVNTSGEDSKYGLRPEDVPAFLGELQGLQRVEGFEQGAVVDRGNLAAAELEVSARAALQPREPVRIEQAAAVGGQDELLVPGATSSGDV